MSSHASFSCAGGLINMDLLHRLSGTRLLPSADSMIKDDHFLDLRNPLFEQRFNFAVVTIPHSRVVSELCFFGGRLAGGSVRGGFVGAIRAADSRAAADCCSACKKNFLQDFTNPCA